jgi:hypothetical protein
MPMYYFNLKSYQGVDLDPDGVELIDDAQAREYGEEVALELMKGREIKTRAWRIDVRDANRRPIAELLFAYADPLVAALRSSSRVTVEQASARTAVLIDTILDIRNSYYELRATLSKSEGKPYLVSDNGSAVLRSRSRKADSRN